MVRRGEKPTTATSDLVFGSRLKPVRENNKWTQEQLALEMRDRGFDFTQATIYKIETGKRKVTIAEALALSELLDTDVSALTAEKDDELSVYQDKLRVMAKALYRAIRDAEAEVRTAQEYSSDLSAEILDFEYKHGVDATLDFNGVVTTPKAFYDRIIWFGNGNIGKGFQEDPDREKDFSLAEYLGL